MADKHHFGNTHGGEEGSEDWYTPLEIINALGRFDLDPCIGVDRPWNTAEKHYTPNEDGLKQEWEGRVWLNPPYGTKSWVWMRKLAEHGNGIGLTFARTETQWFHSEVWEKANALFFFKGRLRFHKSDGNAGDSCAGAPSCLVAYGANNVSALLNCGFKGKFVFLK